MWASLSSHDSLPALQSGVLKCKVRDEPATNRMEAGARVLTIRDLATARWNRRTHQEPGRYRRAGTVFMRQAVRDSLAVGHAGRVGLHSLAG